MKDQQKIQNDTIVGWKKDFGDREYQYLKNVINGLISKGDMDRVFIDVHTDNSARTLHIYEPFSTLNYIGFLSPSVVSIKFVGDKEIEFWNGDDNGIGILSDRLTLGNKSKLPNNAYPEIDFWHFVDNIGEDADKHLSWTTK